MYVLNLRTVAYDFNICNPLDSVYFQKLNDKPHLVHVNMGALYTMAFFLCIGELINQIYKCNVFF